MTMLRIIADKCNENGKPVAVFFNTGRQYATTGQPVAAIVVRDKNGQQEGIVFCDYARGIDGFIPWLGQFFTRNDLPDQTMHCYDYGNYKHVPYEHTELRNKLRNADWGQLRDLMEGL
jgi:hypothetical protein